ncbi:hypothetical protein [Labedaea rhizosphaerae]|uniref:Uncharacterized protein n=1 Tax=Labedaea rhizosphaerae TaxID=598644 RepID=A0A4R6SFB0_LABRH|nr:hypothetical protein [Labedaea rhizosphaerae]TDQ00383.1 hypothetical protein EV186_102244 [Labedaea rhizosphaerae]
MIEPMGEAPLGDALDRFMTSPSLRDARDALREHPELLGNETLAWLEEILRRLRQRNETDHIESVEHWLGLLRVFRRFGVEEGYWELLADGLVRADQAETKRLLELYPELSSDAAREYYDRREHEAHLAADQTAATKYLMASVIPGGRLAEEAFPADTSFAGGFLAHYVAQDDEQARHQYLTDHPEVLDMPAALVAESLFQPPMNQAWADVDVVALRALYLRRALFRRASTVGAPQAIREFEEGAEWPDLITS